MTANNVLGIIFSNSYDEVIPQLTAPRTMGSVPFAGRYRLIDFSLSDMVNASVSKIGVITNSNYRSLMDHIGNGKSWDLARKREGLTFLPPFSLTNSGSANKGKVDALYGSISYISESDKDYVLLSDTNLICSFNYEDMFKFAQSKNADITLAYCNGIPASLDKATEIAMDDDNRVIKEEYIEFSDAKTKYTMKIMLIKRTLLERLLHEAHANGISDLETLTIKNVNNLKIYGYEYEGFIEVIDSLQKYYEANLALLNPENRKKLFRKDSPIYTKTSDRVPAFYGPNSKVVNSLVANGCKIEGTVENCVLFRGVTVEKGAVVKNSILMQGTYVGQDCNINCAIADKKVVFKPHKTLCGAENYPIYIGKEIII